MWLPAGLHWWQQSVAGTSAVPNADVPMFASAQYQNRWYNWNRRSIGVYSRKWLESLEVVNKDTDEEAHVPASVFIIADCWYEFVTINYHAHSSGNSGGFMLVFFVFTNEK